MSQTSIQWQEMPHILVVDDDDRLRSLLKKFLRDQGFMVSVAENGEVARQWLSWFRFDLVVLDVMMPGESGLSLLPDINAPTLMLSALGDADDRIAGLELGAEDYLAKPFEPRELVLRIRAILKRTTESPTDTQAWVTFGQFKFNIGNGQLKRGDDAVYLTGSESDMLKLLAKTPGLPVSREALHTLLPASSNERSVDVQINRLRKKIEESEGKPLFLQTVRGAGYVLYTDGR